MRTSDELLTLEAPDVRVRLSGQASQNVASVPGFVAAPRHTYEATKRTLDIILALFGLIVGLPVFVLIALAVALTDGAPVIYRQQRIGRYGKPFWIYKFRSMRKDADEILRRDAKLREEFEKNYKLERDPRITRVGHILRKTSLDELPQFFNVLIGDMSMVGPRPVLAKEIESLYGADAPYYMAVKPGCAGLWQCSGRSETSYHERVRLDVRYAQTTSIPVDAKIFVKTLFAVVCRKGAQ